MAEVTLCHTDIDAALIALLQTTPCRLQACSMWQGACEACASMWSMRGGSPSVCSEEAAIRAAMATGDVRRMLAGCGTGGRGAMREASAEEWRPILCSREEPPEKARVSGASLEADRFDSPLQPRHMTSL
jgi:hypothetical protein